MASSAKSSSACNKVFHTIPLRACLNPGEGFDDSAATTTVAATNEKGARLSSTGSDPNAVAKRVWPCDLRFLSADDASASVFAIGLEDTQLDQHVYCTSMNVTVKQPILVAQPFQQQQQQGAAPSALAIYHPRPFALLRRQQNTAIGKFLLTLSSMALAGGCCDRDGGDDADGPDRQGPAYIRVVMIVDDEERLFSKKPRRAAVGADDHDDDEEEQRRKEDAEYNKQATQLKAATTASTTITTTGGYDGDDDDEDDDDSSDDDDGLVHICLHFRLEASVLTAAALSAGVIQGSEEIDDVCMRMECARIARPPHVASLALMMAAHHRLGHSSAIGRLLGADLLQLVCAMYRRRLYECRKGVWP